MISGLKPARFVLSIVLALGGCALLESPPVKSALEVLAPNAVDAITRLVKDRWGSDAEADTDSMACVPAPSSSADWFGDDDENDFEYALCRGKAVQ